MGDIKTLFTTTGVTDSDRVLHTPGDFARKNLLYVQEVGRLKSLQPHKSQRENLDSFLFLFVLSGEGTLVTNQQVYHVKKGDCALISCMNYYSHESSAKEPWELLWVHFNGGIAGDYYKLFMEQNGGKSTFRVKDTEEWKVVIERIMECQKQKDLSSELITGDLLLQLVNRCLLAAMSRDEKDQENCMLICNEIREKVNECYQEKSLMKVLSEKYDMNEKALDNSFYRAFGITLRDYILNRRFTAAKELLRFTVKPVETIVAESGIQNDDLFRRLFMDSEGMTAEEYRMKWSQWVK